jgi:hypothetical protein
VGAALAAAQAAAVSVAEGMAVDWVGVGSSRPRDRTTARAGGAPEAVPAATVEAWTVDPVVPLGGGAKGSLFDAVEVTPCTSRHFILRCAFT